MNCKYFEKNMDAFLDNDLSEKEILKIEGHLEECPDCHKKYKSYKKSNNIMRNIFKNTAAPQSLRKQILSKTSKEK